MEAWKRQVLKHLRMVICLLCAASMSPFSATSFVGRCVANSALSRTIAAHCKHPCYFVVLPPSFVSPKTASLQPVIDPELFMIMDVFMDSVLAFSTALFRARHIYCTSKLPTVSSVFSEHTASKYSSNNSASAYCTAFL